MKKKMDQRLELVDLVKRFPFRRNSVRVNLANNPEEVTHKWGRPFLKRGVYSNGVSSGRIMDLVREMLPGCSINRLALNRDLQTPPHRDPLNVGDFWLLFFGEGLEGGGLVTETGEVYSEPMVWHGPIPGRVLHWNLPHTGRKWSVVAYSRKECVREASEKSAE